MDKFMFNLFKKSYCPTCEHKWKIINQVDKEFKDYTDSEPYRTVKTYILQCEKCGDLKSFKIDI